MHAPGVTGPFISQHADLRQRDIGAERDAAMLTGRLHHRPCGGVVHKRERDFRTCRQRAIRAQHCAGFIHIKDRDFHPAYRAIKRGGVFGRMTKRTILHGKPFVVVAPRIAR